jgi:hypothetical protein
VFPRRAGLQAKHRIAQADASENVMIMCIAIKPYISAVPHRIDTLATLFGEMVTDPRVASMRGDENAALDPASEHRV